MKLLTQFKTTIRPVRKPMSPVSVGFLILLLLACFGLAPMAQAVGPDTDGTIPGANNGEGIRGACQPHGWGLEHRHWFRGS